MTDDVPRFALNPLQDADPDVGRWLDMLEDSRKRTREELYELQLTDAELDASPPTGVNTIGAILYHLAVAEVQWIYDNLLQIPPPDSLAEILPYPVLDANGNLSTPRGWRIDSYLERMNAVRACTLAELKPMTPEQFRTPRFKMMEYGAVEFTPEAVIVHLAQHEAEHRGQIQTLAESLRAAR